MGVVNLSLGNVLAVTVAACLFSALRLNLVLTYGISTDCRGDIHVFIPPYAIGSFMFVLLIRLPMCAFRSDRGKASLKSLVVHSRF